LIVFATSDKGGTGRSVTSANMVYRKALTGKDVAYLDFDFGSPTSGAIFQAAEIERGIKNGRGLHSYFRNVAQQPEYVDLWQASRRNSLQDQPGNAGRLVLVPGDFGGSEFSLRQDMPGRCVSLFLRIEEQFDLCLVDLSAGRSYALELALTATARSEFRSIPIRFLVFHRWTRQHIIAAEGLLNGPRGILDTGKRAGWNEDELRSNIKFVHTAVIDPNAPTPTGAPAGLRAPQVNWLTAADGDMLRLAADLGLGHLKTLGSVPLDPVLQWQEQLITDHDVHVREIANRETVASFEKLASDLDNDDMWRS
jgi:hypothetical protein